MSQKVNEVEIKWSYDILESLRNGLDKVAQNPELKPRAVVEFMKCLPDVVDAFLNLVEDEHTGVVAGVFEAAVRAFRAK